MYINMSVSTFIKQPTTDSKSIPSRKVFIGDESQLPSHYSSTPGGTLYSTTPGGTKLMYEKSILMNLRNSPISKTPPTYIIPDSLVKDSKYNPNRRTSKNTPTIPRNPTNKNYDDHQFQLEL